MKLEVSVNESISEPGIFYWRVSTPITNPVGGSQYSKRQAWDRAIFATIDVIGELAPAK